MCVCSVVLTLCNPADCSPPGCSVHGIFRIIQLCFKLKDLGQIIQTFSRFYFLVYDVHSQTFIDACCCWASQVALVIKKKKKHPPASAGDVRDPGSVPGREDPLEKEMATHFSILAWRIPRTEEPGGLLSVGSQRVRHNKA